MVVHCRAVFTIVYYTYMATRGSLVIRPLKVRVRKLICFAKRH